jgi:hypothetical protein
MRERNFKKGLVQPTALWVVEEKRWIEGKIAKG